MAEKKNEIHISSRFRHYFLQDAYEFSSNQSTNFYSYMSKGLNGIGLKDEKVKVSKSRMSVSICLILE